MKNKSSNNQFDFLSTVILYFLFILRIKLIFTQNIRLNVITVKIIYWINIFSIFKKPNMFYANGILFE